MNLRWRKITKQTTLSALALSCLLPACGQISPQLEGTARTGIQEAENGGQTSTPGSSVIPPSPVSGSFLTVVLSAVDGEPLANAAVVVVESQYVGSTNLIGEM